MDSTSLINGFLLEQSYQNPYGATNSITFNLPVAANVKLFVKETGNDKTELQNATICIIYEGILEKGFYKSTWDLKDKDNNYVENGFYYFHINVESFKNDVYEISFSGKTRIIVLR